MAEQIIAVWFILALVAFVVAYMLDGGNIQLVQQVLEHRWCGTSPVLRFFVEVAVYLWLFVIGLVFLPYMLYLILAELMRLLVEASYLNDNF